jgi:hypothetical protein
VLTKDKGETITKRISSGDSTSKSKIPFNPYASKLKSTQGRLKSSDVLGTHSTNANPRLPNAHNTPASSSLVTPRTTAASSADNKSVPNEKPRQSPPLPLVQLQPKKTPDFKNPFAGNNDNKPTSKEPPTTAKTTTLKQNPKSASKPVSLKSKLKRETEELKRNKILQMQRMEEEKKRYKEEKRLQKQQQQQHQEASSLAKETSRQRRSDFSGHVVPPGNSSRCYYVSTEKYCCFWSSMCFGANEGLRQPH